MSGQDSEPGISRRAFMGAAAGAAGVLATTPWAQAAEAFVRQAASTAPAGSGLDSIEHVVMVMQENRSFDHYFGAYPRVRGFDDRSRSKLGAFSQPWPDGEAARLLPYKLDHATLQDQCAGNADVPIHNWSPQHESSARRPHEPIRVDPFEAAERRPRAGTPRDGLPRP